MKKRCYKMKEDEDWNSKEGITLSKIHRCNKCGSSTIRTLPDKSGAEYFKVKMKCDGCGLTWWYDDTE